MRTMTTLRCRILPLQSDIRLRIMVSSVRSAIPRGMKRSYLERSALIAAMRPRIITLNAVRSAEGHCHLLSRRKLTFGVADLAQQLRLSQSTDEGFLVREGGHLGRPERNSTHCLADGVDPERLTT